MREKFLEKNIMSYKSNISRDVKEDKLEPLEDWGVDIQKSDHLPAKTGRLAFSWWNWRFLKLKADSLWGKSGSSNTYTVQD